MKKLNYLTITTLTGTIGGFEIINNSQMPKTAKLNACHYELLDNGLIGRGFSSYVRRTKKTTKFYIKFDRVYSF